MPGATGTHTTTTTLGQSVRAFRCAQGQLRGPQGLPISVRLLCEARRPPADRRADGALGAAG